MWWGNIWSVLGARYLGYMCCSMESGKSGVVYIGHLPHGFYEEELKGYFSQFGSINKVRVARNKKVRAHKCVKIDFYYYYYY